MKSFIAIHAEDAPTGHKVYLVDRGGKPVHTQIHYPWFVASSKQLGPDIVSSSRLHGDMLKFMASGYVYVPAEKAYKIEVVHRSRVPKVAQQVATQGIAGLYNVKYLVRAALDIQREKDVGILGYPTPIAFLPNKEMINYMEDAIDKIADLKVMAVDIEVYSRRGGFPARGDPILSITYSTFKLGDNIFTEDWPEQGIHYILNEDADERGSRRIVREFINVIRRENPDIVVGYNTSGFDFPYMKPFAIGVELTFDFIIDRLRFYPHIDLMVVRDSLGSSLGLRRQSVFALDDVAVEAIAGNKVDKMYGLDWLYGSKYLEAERKLDHAKLKQYFDHRDELFFDYIVADVLLTSYLARIWLYPLFLLSLLTGIPVNVLQGLNTGQMAEYVLSELLTRLGFYPQLIRRTKDYGRLTSGGQIVSKLKSIIPSIWVFERGKVYVYKPGLYGGPGYRIVELDFAQLYPTDMVRNTVDPTSLFITKWVIVDSNGRIESGMDTISNIPLFKDNRTWVMLKDNSSMYFYEVVPGYGPVSWFIYKLYTARNETKKLKKRAKQEKRVELLAPDQAVKIYNNSNYGAFSKTRGNLVNELASAAVFWRTQKLLYEVISAIEGPVSEKMGVKLKVLYGDTDSSYVLAPESIDPGELEKAVNEWIQQHYGHLYRMELEDTYRWMLIPRRKDSSDPSAKSYITLDDNFKIVKIKGDFFKLEAPLAIKDKLIEFYEEVIHSKPKTMKDVESIIARFLRGEPPYKYFIKKSVSSFISEDGTRFKRINRAFHYAALVFLCETGAPGTQLLRESTTGLDGKTRRVVCRIDPRVVEETQRAVIVHYLPSPSGKSTKFAIYGGESGEYVLVDDVNVVKLEVESEVVDKNNAYDKAFVIDYMIRRIEVPYDTLHIFVIHAIKKTVTETIYKKLVLAMGEEGGGVDGGSGG